MAPATGLAAILFYLTDNPPTGRASNGYTALGTSGDVASASWWILFICVRQVTTFSLAMLAQLLVVDFLCLGTRVLLKLLGPVLTLLLAQSKGWPFVTLTWCAFNFALLYGDHQFAHHWLYFQEKIELFNFANPSGHVVDSDWYFRVLIIGISVSVVVAIKRLILGLFLGRQTYGTFNRKKRRCTPRTCTFDLVNNTHVTIVANIFFLQLNLESSLRSY